MFPGPQKMTHAVWMKDTAALARTPGMKTTTLGIPIGKLSGLVQDVRHKINRLGA